MRNIFIIILIPFLAFSQNDEKKDLYPFSFGAGLYTKGSVNAVVQPKSRKTDFLFNEIPDFYVSAYLPYSETNNIGIFLESGFNYHQYLTENASTGDKYTASMNYFSFSPYLYLENFLLGFSINIPFAANYDLPSGTPLTNEDVNEVERLNNMFEIKLGYIYTIYEDLNGRLNANFVAAYSFNGMYNDYPRNDPYLDIIPQEEDYPITRVFNPRIASINIGISYFFYLNL